ncbi:hypothetical protein HK100_012236, partial [Physocladia obscura]
MSEDVVVRTVGDASVRASDARLLDDGAWLNDALIHFAYEELRLGLHGGGGGGGATDGGVFLAAPALVHLLVNAPDAAFARAVASPLGLPAKHSVFLPVNDCLSLDAPGGSHW